MVDPFVARMAGSSITNKHGIEPVQEIITVNATANGERKRLANMCTTKMASYFQCDDRVFIT